MIGTVYMIWSAQSPKRYYGSTIQTLSMRMCGHRGDMKRWRKDNTRFCSSFEILCFDDARIEWVETVEFTDRAELVAREGWWMRNNESVNERIAGRGKAEYRSDNKEAVAAYYVEHKEEFASKHAVYYAAHKEEIKIHVAAYNMAHKEEIAAKHAAYYVTNKEALSARRVAYYAKHKEEAAAYNADHKEERKARIAVKVECPCGATHTYGVSAKHAKTKKHLAYLANI